MTRKIFLALALIFFLWVPAPSALAAVAPDVSAEGAILTDASTGAVLYEKNAHAAYFPASITKILTALVVIENSDLHDQVELTHSAVSNVEEGSSSAGLCAGDTLSVEELLYAMLLKSANEAANALAEHVAGSNAAFAAMMNEKAAELGCTDSNFANPSGLNDPNHYVSAADMAIIARAAFSNADFVRIDSAFTHTLPPTKQNPEGLVIFPGHRMLRPASPLYYEGIVGGKTGYTMLAGNTLVTCAEKDGLRLICVVLNGHKTHYDDTKALLDYGFSSYRSVPVATAFSALLPADGLSFGTKNSMFQFAADAKLTLPADIQTADVQMKVAANTTGATDQADPQETDPAPLLAEFFYEDRQLGSAGLYLTEPENAAAGTSQQTGTADLSAADDTFSADTGDAGDTFAADASAADTTSQSLKDSILRRVTDMPFILLFPVFLLFILFTAAFFFVRKKTRRPKSLRRVIQEYRRQKKAR